MNCEYPPDLIKKGFHNAKLQVPAPNPKEKSTTLPFVTSLCSNYDVRNICKLSNKLLNSSHDDKVCRTFRNTKTVLSLRQPKNLLRHLSTSKFVSNPALSTTSPVGLFKCKSKKCVICRNYLQACSSFITANNTEWKIKCPITCNSINVIYYLVCACCLMVSYTGKTNNLRLRTNQHISEIRTGVGTDKFDKHVFNCRQEHGIPNEPYFKLYAFLKVSRESLLIPYESYLHAQKYDTMN